MGISDAPQKSFTPYKPKKGEEYMSDKQKDHFRHILHAWRDELGAEMDRARHRMQDETVNYPDPTDRGRHRRDAPTTVLSRREENP